VKNYVLTPKMRILIFPCRELWKDFLITQIKTLGGIHYWMGEIIGRSLVDSGALSEEYYNFMITIKKALDPNKILSPGKFYLGDNY